MSGTSPAMLDDGRLQTLCGLDALSGIDLGVARPDLVASSALTAGKTNLFNWLVPAAAQQRAHRARREDITGTAAHRLRRGRRAPSRTWRCSSTSR
jgi:hypothetical protein